MEKIKPGVLGILDASLKYFDCYNQEMQLELEEKKNILEGYLKQLKEVKEEKIRIENECSKFQMKMTKLSYFNNQCKKEIFSLQEKIFEIETGNS